MLARLQIRAMVTLFCGVFGGHAMVGEAFCSDSSFTEALESPTVRSDGMLGSYGLGSSPFACALEHVCRRHGDTVRLQGRL